MLCIIPSILSRFGRGRYARVRASVTILGPFFDSIPQKVIAVIIAQVNTHGNLTGNVVSPHAIDIATFAIDPEIVAKTGVLMLAYT